LTPLQLVILDVLYRVDSYLSVPAIVRRASLPKTVDFREVSSACKELVRNRLLEETRNAPGKKKGTYGYRLSVYMREAMKKRVGSSA
jgi:hypothetical protein